MQEQEPDVFEIRKNPLPRLLAEAVVLIDLEGGSGPIDSMDRAALAKASIVASAFAIECAASCCVERMKNYPAGLRTEPERLTSTEKYDLLYQSCKGKRLDKGIPVFQRIETLTALRDSLAHAKVGLERGTLKSTGGKNFEFCKAKDAQRPKKSKHEKWQCLKLPEDTWEWRGEHARHVFVCVVQFLNWFFIDQCELTPKDAAVLLGSSADGKAMLNPAEGEILRYASRTLKVAFRFLNLEGPESPAH
jgi:hypothetical protein